MKYRIDNHIREDRARKTNEKRLIKEKSITRELKKSNLFVCKIHVKALFSESEKLKYKINIQINMFSACFIVSALGIDILCRLWHTNNIEVHVQ